MATKNRNSTQSTSSLRPIGIDLFAGAGGMSLGFEQAGFDILVAVEIDPIHCATHEFNFPRTKIICGDLSKLTGKEIKEKAGLNNKDDIDVVFGGPPCQGFSLIGKREINDPRNQLVFEFVRLVKELKPKYFVMENVPGMIQGDSISILFEVIDKFEQSGYKIEKNYKILNAAEYGVPQNRKRLFLLGCRNELELPNYPEAITRLIGVKSKFNNDLPNCPTVADAIQDLPNINLYRHFEEDAIKANFGDHSEYAKKLHFIELRQDFSYPRKYDAKFLTSSLKTQHSKNTIKRFKDTECGKIEPISHFYKLNPYGICHTLRAGTPRNRGSFASPRPIHYKYNRCITVREAARLHSYPDWFRFHTTKWHGFRQIGNSVPPLLAKAIASEIIKVLNIQPILNSNLLEGNIELLSYNMTQAAQYYQVDPNIIEPRARKSS